MYQSGANDFDKMIANSTAAAEGYFRARANSLPDSWASDLPPTKIFRAELGGMEDKFSPMMQSTGETGCGSTTYKPLSAFSSGSSKEEKNLLSTKVDEDFSSCRTPLEVLSDMMTDKEQMENIPEDMRRRLLAKSEKLKDVSPSCNCIPTRVENGPYYVYLGHSQTKDGLRTLMEQRTGARGQELRIEVIRFTGKEGKTSQDCPIAKWVLRRSQNMEQYMVIVKKRIGHQCQYTWVVVAIIQWEGLSRSLSDTAYNQLAQKTARYGSETDRQCAANKKKTCACQGVDMNFSGASYTFGCSWTMYHNICKFCRSADAHKFKLSDFNEESDLENICTQLVDALTPIYSRLAPDSHNNMCLFEEVAADCRIGTRGSVGLPFSGITCVCDFCAHSHKDSNNMIGGSTAVVTLLRPEYRDLGARIDDEQFHVLPLYVPDGTSAETEVMVAKGGLEILDRFRRTISIREKKKEVAKRGRISTERKRMLDGQLAKDCSLSERALPQLDGAYGSESDEDYNEIDSVENLVEKLKIVTHETDCLEAFDDPEIGGVALALPHGSILIEAAKQEQHATTALRNPDRTKPHRIGLVFYQHKNLHLPGHGAEEFQRKRIVREFRDYVQWLKGNYVPTEMKLRAMSESGFVFPEEVKTVAKPMDVANPEDFFKDDKFNTSPDKMSTITEEIEVTLGPGDQELDKMLPVFLTKQIHNQDEAEIEDEINIAPLFEEDTGELTKEEEEEIRKIEEEMQNGVFK